MHARFRLARRLIGIAAILAWLAVFAAGQTARPSRDSGGPDLVTCSPAPCVLPPTQVSAGGMTVDNAPVVADPANPEHLIVGSVDFNCPSHQGDLGFYLSTDGGSSWNDLVCMNPALIKGTKYVPDGNPILDYDRNGVAYIGGFYIDDSGQSSFGFEGFEKSSDGVLWSSPSPAVTRQEYAPEYCWMAVDTSAISPYVNSVYISCVLFPLRTGNQQVVVSHSNDGGATWQQVNVAPPQGGAVEDLNTAMTVDGDGTVYLTWMYYNMNNACDNGLVYMVCSKSSDGGSTWSQPRLVTPTTLVYPLPNTENVYVPNTPAIAADNSNGPNTGNLYVVMYNWTGTFMQVQVVRSTDGGNTWSKPVPVSPPSDMHDQFLPWLSVSPNGLVGVSWLDRRNDPANIDYQAFAAISADGGQSFQPNVQLTTAFSNPGIGHETTMGNYTGNTWDGPNYFIAAWMDSSNGMDMQDVVGGIRLK